MVISALVAVVITCIGATAAQASGPVWVTGAAPGRELATGETKRISTIGNLSVMKLRGELAGVVVVTVCKKLSKGTEAAEIMGGNPGEDKAELLFSECSVEGKPNCEARQRGGAAKAPIVAKVLTMLAYPEGRFNGNMALDAFFPKESNNVFAEFEFVGAECGTLTLANPVVVSAAGTEVTLTLPAAGTRRKCGVLGEVGRAEGAPLKYVLSEPERPALKGALNFPAAALTRGEYWNGTAAAALRCELRAFGNPATQIGEGDIELENNLEVGWKV